MLSSDHEDTENLLTREFDWPTGFWCDGQELCEELRSAYPEVYVIDRPEHG